MVRLVAMLRDRANVSHDGRMAFASFALSVGIAPGDVARAFRNTPNFDERTTLRQLESLRDHLPFNCDKMRDKGLCDQGMMVGLCHHIKNPITFHRVRSNDKILAAESIKPVVPRLKLMVAFCKCGWRSRPLPGPHTIHSMGTMHLMTIGDDEVEKHDVTYLEAERV